MSDTAIWVIFLVFGMVILLWFVVGALVNKVDDLQSQIDALECVMEPYQ